MSMPNDEDVHTAFADSYTSWKPRNSPPELGAHYNNMLYAAFKRELIIAHYPQNAHIIDTYMPRTMIIDALWYDNISCVYHHTFCKKDDPVLPRPNLLWHMLYEDPHAGLYCSRRLYEYIPGVDQHNPKSKHIYDGQSQHNSIRR